MSGTNKDDWSPADNPYAIAVSEAQWWMHTTKLAVLRMRDGEDYRVGFSSRQIDARQIVFALKQLLAAEDLEQRALTELAMYPQVGEALALARQRFEAALPDVKHMRDALMHFEDWSRGMGRGPQQDQRRTGATPRDVARLYWGFGYDPTTGTISLGPYAIHVDTAARVASDLARAIYLAAHQVDCTATAAVRAAVVRALDHAGLPHGSPEDVILVSPGHDLRIWISLRVSAESDLVACRQLATHVQTALSVGELHLVSAAEPHAYDVIDRLARGEPLSAVETGPDDTGLAVPE